jgi:DNA-binding NarL/FixJ family response regulator
LHGVLLHNREFPVEIAREQNLSANAIKVNINNINRKLGVKNRVMLDILIGSASN